MDGTHTYECTSGCQWHFRRRFTVVTSRMFSGLSLGLLGSFAAPVFFARFVEAPFLPREGTELTHVCGQATERNSELHEGRKELVNQHSHLCI